MIPIEHDHSRAGTHDRPQERPDRLVEAVEAHQAHESRRFAAGNDQAVEPVELLGLADLDGVRPEPTEHREVLAEVALDGKNTNLHAGNGSPGDHLRRGVASTILSRVPGI